MMHPTLTKEKQNKRKKSLIFFQLNDYPTKIF